MTRRAAQRIIRSRGTAYYGLWRLPCARAIWPLIVVCTRTQDAPHTCTRTCMHHTGMHMHTRVTCTHALRLAAKPGEGAAGALDQRLAAQRPAPLPGGPLLRTFAPFSAAHPLHRGSHRRGAAAAAPLPLPSSQAVTSPCPAASCCHTLPGVCSRARAHRLPACSWGACWSLWTTEADALVSEAPAANPYSFPSV